MNKNKIFIITGALFFGLFIALLFWLQTMEGQPKDLQNSYQIEIFNAIQLNLPAHFKSLSTAAQILTQLTIVDEN